MKSQFRSEAGALEVQQRHRELLARWPGPREERRVATREGETFVLACGPREAPPVLLLHGGGTSSAMWTGCIPSWTTRLRVYAVDLIGEAGLSAPSRPAPTPGTYAGWLDDVMNALGLERASLVAASMGGWIALDQATRHPERIDRLVLLSPLGIGRQRPGFLLRVMPLLLLGRRGRRMVLRAALGPATPGDEVMAFMDLVQDHLRPRMVAFSVFSDQALSRLAMPVVAVLGGRDVIVDAAQARARLERLVPGVDVRLHPELGHGLPDPTALVLEAMARPVPIPESTRGQTSASPMR